MVDTCHHTPVHTKELYNAKSELYKLWTFVSNNGSILVHLLEQMYLTNSRCYNRETGYGREGGGVWGLPVHSAQFFGKSTSALRSVRTVLGIQQVLSKWWLLAGCEAGCALMAETSQLSVPICPWSHMSIHLGAEAKSCVYSSKGRTRPQVRRKALQGGAVSSWFIYSFLEMLILFCVPFLVQLYIIRRIKNCVYPYAHGERWGSGRWEGVYTR